MAAHRRSILITGASSGLGAGMARAYAAQGHDLALCARRLDALNDLKAELSSAGQIEVRALDVNEHEAVFAVFKDLDIALGGIDRAIINAGISDGRSLGLGYFANNLKIAETNFVAAVAQIEAALDIFRRRGAGHLVLIASMAAVREMPRSMATYAASKAGLAHLGKGLAIEFAQTPIRVSTVLPGYIRTPLVADKGPLPWEVDEERGVRALVREISKEKRLSYVPPWRWAVIAFIIRLMPFALYRRSAGND
jgi:short-subunit dehydrogenase